MWGGDHVGGAGGAGPMGTWHQGWGQLWGGGRASCIKELCPELLCVLGPMHIKAGSEGTYWVRPRVFKVPVQLLPGPS